MKYTLNCLGNGSYGNSKDFCKNKADGHYSDPVDCGKFYQCSYGLTFHEYCAPGTAFSVAMMGCDFPINVPGCENYGGWYVVAKQQLNT